LWSFAMSCKLCKKRRGQWLRLGHDSANSAAARCAASGFGRGNTSAVSEVRRVATRLRANAIIPDVADGQSAELASGAFVPFRLTSDRPMPLQSQSGRPRVSLNCRRTARRPEGVVTEKNNDELSRSPALKVPRHRQPGSRGSTKLARPHRAQ